MSEGVHGNEAPSAWVRRWSHLVPEGGAVLDVACGYGRHMRHFARLGHPVVGVDLDAQAIAAVAPLGRAVQADTENGPWPFAGETFAAVVVTHYLWRALLPTIVGSVAPGGVLIYETFSRDQASVGKPSRPDFLLQPGELLLATRGLRVIAYEDGFCEPPARFVQRVVALREPASEAGPPARHRLDAAG